MDEMDRDYLVGQEGIVYDLMIDQYACLLMQVVVSSTAPADGITIDK